MAKTRKKAISEPPSMPQVGDKVYPGKSEMLYEISHVSHDGAEVNLHVPGTYLETFAIVTTKPNELVAQIHDRLALILHPRDYDRWLGIDDHGGDIRPRLTCSTPMTPTR